MKKTKFKVIFSDDTELILWAGSALQAMFLGASEKIGRGESYRVYAVVNAENRELFVVDKSALNNVLKKIDNE
jgi:hypothetical protein